ncbi:hypothetical protein [Marinobacter sp.]|uniref:hypothetical protein n=1 Tax=Marinobacter sp. TaxID=50741 RepID=UPI0019B2BB52|nr:hypothetical protein [Marinobacter sp.]MBC7193723.1 hypothetical protein [Marinobacter sp.]
MHTRSIYSSEIVVKHDKMQHNLENNYPGLGLLRTDVFELSNSLNNLIDYLSKEYPDYIKQKWQARNANELRINLEKAEASKFGISVPKGLFGYIRDIANVGKHMSIGRPDATVTRVSDVTEAIGFIRYGDDSGHYYGHKYLVLVKKAENLWVPAEFLLDSGFLVATKLLMDIGLIPGLPKNKKINRNLYISREESENLKKPKINTRKGEYLSVALRTYIYLENDFFQIRSAKPNETFKSKNDIKVVVDDSIFEE